MRLSLKEGLVHRRYRDGRLGKTTLVRTLLGLLPKDEGTVAWNGQMVNDPGTFFIPGKSAYTAQVPRLYSDTLRNNILLGHPSDAGEHEAGAACCRDGI